MKINLKVSVGFALIVCCSVYTANSYWQSYKEQEQRRIDVINSNNFKSQLDCSSPNNKAEKIICSDSVLLELDKELYVAFRNASLLTHLQSIHSRKKQEDAQCSNDCLLYMDRIQRDWLSDVRNDCESAECLVDAYQARIIDLNGQPEPLPSFKLWSSLDTAMCNAMLDVLNRPPRDTLGTCSRYDFTGSPFMYADSIVPPKHWQAVEKLLYEKNHSSDGKYSTPILDFEERWSKLQIEYNAGVRELYGAKEDEHHELPHFMEVRYPSFNCQALTNQPVTERKKVLDKFKEADASELLSHAENYGRESMVFAPYAGQSGSLYAGQLVFYNQEWFVLQQSSMNRIIGSESYGQYKTPIYLKKIYPDMNIGKFIAQGNMCIYWYNY